MKKYKYEIKFENQNWWKSIEIFNCDAKNTEESEKILWEYLLYSGLLGADYNLLK